MTNVIKLNTPFERIKLCDSLPEINLRKAIITQAIIDATNISDAKQFKQIEIDAKNWIFGNSKSFKETCQEMGIEVDFVKHITRELIKLHKKQSLTRKNNRGSINYCSKSTLMFTDSID